MNSIIIALAILPGIIISYLIFRMDKYDKEPKLYLAICFILGMLITWPAMQMETYGDSLGLNESGNIGQLFGSAFLVVGFSEELVKFFILLLVAYPLKAFDEPFDGITYAVMIGMGFATLENILYANLYGLETVLLRAFTAVPAHAIFGVFMGYYVGKAKFETIPTKRYQLIALGLFIPLLIHGLYDIFILQPYYDWLMSFATLTLLISGYFAFQLIRKHQNTSPFKDSTKKIIADATPSNEASAVASSVDTQVLEPETDNEIMSSILDEMKKEEEE